MDIDLKSTSSTRETISEEMRSLTVTVSAAVFSVMESFSVDLGRKEGIVGAPIHKLFTQVGDHSEKEDVSFLLFTVSPPDTQYNTILARLFLGYLFGPLRDCSFSLTSLIDSFIIYLDPLMPSITEIIESERWKLNDGVKKVAKRCELIQDVLQRNGILQPLLDEDRYRVSTSFSHVQKPSHRSVRNRATSPLPFLNSSAYPFASFHSDNLLPPPKQQAANNKIIPGTYLDCGMYLYLITSECVKSSLEKIGPQTRDELAASTGFARQRVCTVLSVYKALGLIKESTGRKGEIEWNTGQYHTILHHTENCQRVIRLRNTKRQLAKRELALIAEHLCRSKEQLNDMTSWERYPAARPRPSYSNPGLKRPVPGKSQRFAGGLFAVLKQVLKPGNSTTITGDPGSSFHTYQSDSSLPIESIREYILPPVEPIDGAPLLRPSGDHEPVIVGADSMFVPRPYEPHKDLRESPVDSVYERLRNVNYCGPIIKTKLVPTPGERWLKRDISSMTS